MIVRLNDTQWLDSESGGIITDDGKKSITLNIGGAIAIIGDAYVPMFRARYNYTGPIVDMGQGGQDMSRSADEMQKSVDKGVKQNGQVNTTSQ